RQKSQCLPSALNLALIVALFGAEHVRLRAEETPKLKNLCETAVRIEGDTPILLILRRVPWDTDLVAVPVHPLVLNQQHFAAATYQFQCTDDAIVEHRTDVPVLPAAHQRRCVEKSSFLVT